MYRCVFQTESYAPIVRACILKADFQTSYLGACYYPSFRPGASTQAPSVMNPVKTVAYTLTYCLPYAVCVVSFIACLATYSTLRNCFIFKSCLRATRFSE